MKTVSQDKSVDSEQTQNDIDEEINKKEEDLNSIKKKIIEKENNLKDNKRKKRSSVKKILFDTDVFVSGIRDSLFNLDLSHNRRSFSYRKGRSDFIYMVNELSSFYALGKSRTEEALLRFGASMCMDYAKETGLYDYYELYLDFIHCPLGLAYSGSVHRDNLNISDLEGDKTFWIHCSENEIDDGLNDGLVSTSSLLSTVSDMLGVDGGYAAYLCLSLGIISSYELRKKFNYVEVQCTAYSYTNKIRNAFKSKKGDFKRWLFGNGVAIHNIYMADKKYRTENSYKFLCRFRKKFRRDVVLGIIPKPDKEVIKW